MRLSVTPRQMSFLKATAFEVLYGGAAGGGKSYGQLIDALLYALRYPGSKQLIVRRTYGELEKSLIRAALALYPRAVYRYVSSAHLGRFTNGSIIDFGSLENENDVYKYQSAEYDVIRFEELTHFSEDMYLYMISRVRGVNDYPKSVRSTTNPGGVGHSWVKGRFIDPAPADTVFDCGTTTRIFLPARIFDNRFLMRQDPDYLKRLENLGDRERRALLDGDWDIFEGQYFTEFSRRLHVCRPFEIPKHWRRYRALDYGLDMLACLFIACDEGGRAYVYKEIYEPGLIVSRAARRILELTDEPIYATFAPPDLWNRHKDTGRSTAEIFHEQGIALTRAENNRVQGWLDLREWLAPYRDEQERQAVALMVFENCRNLIRTLPALRVDAKNPSDVANTPHELTHAPDALRYFAAGRPRPAAQKPSQRTFHFASQRPNKSPLGRGERTRVI